MEKGPRNLAVSVGKKFGSQAGYQPAGRRAVPRYRPVKPENLKRNLFLAMFVFGPS
jgi:hypothetical protein